MDSNKSVKGTAAYNVMDIEDEKKNFLLGGIAPTRNDEAIHPWEEPGMPYKTQSQFYAWLRGVLRKAWSRFPNKTTFEKNNQVRAPVGINGRVIWAGKCSMCNELFKKSDLHIDHVHAAGSLKGPEDLERFATRLYIPSTRMRWLCIPCHSLVTLAEQKDISLEDAVWMQKAIATLKLKAVPLDAWIDKHEIHIEGRRNKVKREDAVKAYYKHQHYT